MSFFGVKKKFTIENVRHLCLEIKRVESEGKSDVLVEALRELVEVVVWGDKNDDSIFDVFLEHHIVEYFATLIRKTGPSCVKVQVIQCLTILMQNLTREQSVFFVCSKNHINDIISFKFDLNDEDILSNYISFLKTLSLRMNENSAHFFFSETSFPLYEEAAKLFDNDDRMVRAAARSVVLNILQLKDKQIAKFLEQSLDTLFSTLCGFVKQSIRKVDIKLRVYDNFKTADIPGDIMPESAIDTAMEDLIDDFYYLNDISQLPQENISQKLVNAVTKALVQHLFLDSLENVADPLVNQTDTRISTSFVFLLMSNWINVNTISDIHKAMVQPLLFGKHVDGSPIKRLSGKGGILCEALRSSRLRIHIPALGVVYAILGSNLTTEEERRIILGSPRAGGPCVYPLKGSDIIPEPQCTLNDFANKVGNIKRTYVPMNVFAREEDLPSIPTDLENVSKVIYSNAGSHLIQEESQDKLQHDYPFASAIVSSLLKHIAYKEVAVIRHFRVILDSFFTIGSNLSLDVVVAQLVMLADCCRMNIDVRCKRYGNHIFMINGGRSESSVTLTSLLSRLMDKNPGEELNDARETIFFRLASEQNQSEWFATHPCEVKRVCKTVRSLIPVYPCLHCWRPEISTISLDGEMQKGTGKPEKYMQMQKHVTNGVSILDRAAKDEFELEFVEMIEYLSLRTKLFRNCFDKQDPLVTLLRNYYSKTYVPRIVIRDKDFEILNATPPNLQELREGKKFRWKMHYFVKHHGEGVRCQYISILTSDLLHYPKTGSVLYLFVTNDRKCLLLVKPSCPSDPFISSGRVIFSLPTYQTKAEVDTEVPFKLSLVFGLTPSKITLVTQDQHICDKIVKKIQKASNRSKLEGSLLVHELLSEPTLYL